MFRLLLVLALSFVTCQVEAGPLRRRRERRAERPAVVAQSAAQAAAVIPIATERATFSMQGVNKLTLSDADIRKVDGFVIRTTWAAVEPTNGTFNWSYVKGQLDRAARLGKVVHLQVLSGDDAPRWLQAAGAKVFRSSDGTIPVPWDPVFQSRYERMIKALASKLNEWSHARRVTHFHTIGADNSEWHYRGNFPGFYSVAGYSDSKMVSAHVWAVGTLIRHLPTSIIVCDIGDHEQAWTGQAIAQLKSKYKGSVGFQMDSLSAKTNLAYKGFTRIQQAAAEGHHAGFEMVSGSQDGSGAPIDRFGGPLSAAFAKYEKTKAQWCCIYKADADDWNQLEN